MKKKRNKIQKESLFIKDNNDGEEYCISGNKHFYLINVTEGYISKMLLSSALTEMEALKRTDETQMSHDHVFNEGIDSCKKILANMMRK